MRFHYRLRGSGTSNQLGELAGNEPPPSFVHRPGEAVLFRSPLQRIRT